MKIRRDQIVLLAELKGLLVAEGKVAVTGKMKGKNDEIAVGKHTTNKPQHL